MHPYFQDLRTGDCVHVRLIWRCKWADRRRIHLAFIGGEPVRAEVTVNRGKDESHPLGRLDPTWRDLERMDRLLDVYRGLEPGVMKTTSPLVEVRWHRGDRVLGRELFHDYRPAVQDSRSLLRFDTFVWRLTFDEILKENGDDLRSAARRSSDPEVIELDERFTAEERRDNALEIFEAIRGIPTVHRQVGMLASEVRATAADALRVRDGRLTEQEYTRSELARRLWSFMHREIVQGYPQPKGSPMDQVAFALRGPTAFMFSFELELFGLAMAAEEMTDFMARLDWEVLADECLESAWMY